MAIATKAIEQYFPVGRFVICCTKRSSLLESVDRIAWQYKSKLLSSRFLWRCLLCYKYSNFIYGVPQVKTFKSSRSPNGEDSVKAAELHFRVRFASERKQITALFLLTFSMRSLPAERYNKLIPRVSVITDQKINSKLTAWKERTLTFYK